MKMKRMFSILGVCATVALATFCGCQKADSRSAISGEILRNGQPVPSGTIQFVPLDADSSKGVVGASAPIVDGRYEIAQKGVGLLPGRYQVRIVAVALRNKKTGELVDPSDVKDGVVNPLDCVDENLVPEKYGVDSEEQVEIGKTKKTTYNLNMLDD